MVAVYVLAGVVSATLLMRHTGFTRGNLSAHLSKLEAAGYITIEKEFVRKKTCTMLSLTPEGRDAFGMYHESMTTALGSVSVDRDGVCGE